MTECDAIRAFLPLLQLAKARVERRFSAASTEFSSWDLRPAASQRAANANREDVRNAGLKARSTDVRELRNCGRGRSRT